MPKTAAQSYAERTSEIDDLLKQIARAMKAHRKRAAADPRNWGFAGDLEHAGERLREALAAITPTDANQ